MNYCIDILLIAVCMVIVIDISGAVESLKFGIRQILGIKSNIRLKPLDCSFCMTFWFGLAYLIGNGILTIPYLTYVLFIAYCTPIILDILYLIKEVIIKILNRF